MNLGINTLFLIPGEVGGSETYFTETVASMMKAEPRHRFTFYTNRENHEYLRELFEKQSPDVCFWQTGIPATNRYARIIREQTQLPRMAKRDAIDVLWSPGYTAPLRAGCRQVVSVLDMQYRSHPEDLSWLARLTTDVLVRGAAKAADRLIAISEFSASEIVRYTRATRDQIAVTPLAVSEEFGRPSDATLPVPADRPYILCVANTYPHKNVHSLVHAFALLAGELEHNLVVVGKARRGERAYRDAVSQRGLDERILRLERVSREELIALYRGADCFVFPSLYEGFGLPVLEGMMAGTPVITTRSGSLPEVGGDVAVYAHPVCPETLETAIRNVLKMTPGERAEMVRSARDHAASFTWAQTAEKTLRAIHEALA